jgi:hypothetical protein
VSRLTKPDKYMSDNNTTDAYGIVSLRQAVALIDGATIQNLNPERPLDDSAAFKVTVGGNSIIFSRIYNRPTHWHVYPLWVKDIKLNTHNPLSYGSTEKVDHTVARATKPNALSNKIVAWFAEWTPLFDKSREMAEASTSYYVRRKQTRGKLLAAGCRPDGRDLDNVLFPTNTCTYGTVKHYSDNSVSLDLPSLPVGVATKIIRLIQSESAKHKP